MAYPATPRSDEKEQDDFVDSYTTEPTEAIDYLLKTLP